MQEKVWRCSGGKSMCSGKDNENLSGKEFRGVIHFLWIKRFSPTERHRQLIQMYSDDVMRIQHFRKWCRGFWNLPKTVLLSIAPVVLSCQWRMWKQHQRWNCETECVTLSKHPLTSERIYLSADVTVFVNLQFSGLYTHKGKIKDAKPQSKHNFICVQTSYMFRLCIAIIIGLAFRLWFCIFSFCLYMFTRRCW